MNTESLIIRLNKQSITLWVEGDKLKFKAPPGVMNAEIVGELKANKKSLIEFIQQAQKTKKYHQIPKANNPSGPFPLSFAQKRLWFLAQMEEQGTSYNIPGILRLEGQLDIGALENSIGKIIQRHESLRTLFPAVEGQPTQAIQTPEPFSLPLINLQTLDESTQDKEVFQFLGNASHFSFDLDQGPLLCAYLLCLKKNVHVLIFNMHHIISDGWSMGVFSRELVYFYQEVVTGKKAELPELPIQYSDFSSWQHGWLTEEVLAKQLSFWKKHLAGAPALLELPLDHPRPAVQTFRGNHIAFQLDAQLTERLNAFSKQHNATLFMTLLTGFAVLLSRYSKTEDMVIGLPIANRTRPELENLIGFFVNTLALRVNLSDQPHFAKLLEHVRQVTLDAYQHQDLPFEQVVEAIHPERGLSHHPLFQVMFALQNAPASDMDIPGLNVSKMSHETSHSKFDLFLEMMETKEGLEGKWEYSVDLFDEQTIARMSSHFQTLLQSIVDFSTMSLSSLPLMLDPEKQQLLDWGKIQEVSTDSTCLHKLFEIQAAQSPDAIALLFEDQTLTYFELNQRANQLAHYLLEQGISVESHVGLCIECSLEMVIGILGILKAGAAYVPLNPSYPKARLDYMIEDAKIPLIVTQTELLKILPDITFSLNGHSEQAELAGHSVENPDTSQVSQSSRSLAYIIYTSGSTGQPKGVLVEHHHVYRLFKTSEVHFDFNCTEVWTLFHSVAFDFSVWELWGALAHGGKLVVVPRTISRSPDDFYRLLVRHSVTILCQTPSAFYEFSKWALQQNDALALRYVIFGGEALNPQKLGDWFSQFGDQQPALINMYGITETTVHVTFHRICAEETQSVKNIVGRPLPDLSTYVCQPNLELVPIGVPGELLVGGEGVTRGYLNRAELTNERFIENPFVTSKKERLYRSGDLVQWNANGVLEYLGRIDHQVKIRGHRVELGEIEAVLNSIEGISDSVVVASDQENLIAYVINQPQKNESMRLYQEQLDLWSEIYQDLYALPQEVDEAKFNFVGWHSSYTEDDYSREEMVEWADRTTGRILSCQPKKIYEIGCGVGLLLFRILPHCQSYVASDFSKHSLNHIEKHLASRPEKSIELLHREAHSFENIDPVDLVILNSVIQYFPDLEYLLLVLEQAISVVEPGGSLFIGDVRHYGLMEEFHTSIELFKASPDLSLTKLQHNILRNQTQDNELCLSPQWFANFPSLFEKISHVEIMPKIGVYDTELNLYRYDVVLHVGTTGPLLEPNHWIDWAEESMSLEKLSTLLEEESSDIIGFVQVPNFSIQADLLAVDLLKNERDLLKVSDLQEHLDVLRKKTPSWKLHDLEKLADEKGYSLEVNWHQNQERGSFQIAFKASGFENQKVAFPLPKQLSDQREGHANNPLQALQIQYLLPILQEKSVEQLPEFMTPSAIVFLEKFPLTSNGKLDRVLLSKYFFQRDSSNHEYVPPRTPIQKELVQVFSDVLRGDSIGIYDNFFELGGHSLLATRVIALIRKKMEVDLKIQSIFTAPTVQQLSELIEQEATQVQTVPIEVISHEQPLPLSYGQQRLWFLQNLEGPSATYNMTGAFFITGALNVDKLESSLQMIVERHEILRTSFTEKNGQPAQIVEKGSPFKLTIIDSQHIAAEQRTEYLQQFAKRESNRPFDLEKTPLLRVHLVMLAEGEYFLFLNMHHIIGDGWSMSIFCTELNALYREGITGIPANLHPLSVQYGDVAHWQQQDLQKQKLEESLDYWKAKLDDVPTILNLPTDRMRPSVQTFQGDAHHFQLDGKLTEKLRQLTQVNEGTLFMTLLTGFGLLLSRYSGTEDLSIGTPIANRTRPELENLIGFFVNTLVLRLDFSGNPGIKTMLQRTRQMTLDAYDHQDVPFEQIVEAVKPERHLSHSPLFQVMFALQNVPVEMLELPGLAVRSFPSEHHVAKFDFFVQMIEAEDALHGIWEYNTDLFDRQTVEAMSIHFQMLLEGMVQQTEQTVFELQMLDDGHKHQLLVERNNTQQEFPETYVHHLFEKQVLQTPEAVALVFQNEKWTYSTLNEQANRVAHLLIEKGVKANDLVGICVERSSQMLIGMLGILKAGGAYVPLDADYPHERSCFMIQDTNVNLVLSQKHLPNPSSLSVKGSLQWLDIDVLLDSSGLEHLENPEVRMEAGNRSHVIYTSGSTGTPKGVAIQHRSTTNLICWAQGIYSKDELAGVFASTSISFDLSVFEIFVPLSVGGAVVLGSNAMDLVEKSFDYRITLLNTVPSAFQALLAHACLPSSVQTVNLAGEPFGNPLIEKAYEFPHIHKIYNLYGPSEATTYSTFGLVTSDRSPYYSVGKPISNTQIFLLDSQLQPVPVGVVGEIFIGGHGLAENYINQPKLTDEKFVLHALDEYEPMRLYRTGDLGCWHLDGNLEFLGRIDHQVKLRGFRIELGEIESCLLSHADVCEAVVLLSKEQSENRQLIAYFVLENEKTLDAGALRRFLEESLPHYMIPSVFVPLERLPLTANGKLNRHALPEPDQKTLSQKVFVGASSDNEKALVSIWEKLLNVNEIGIHDNFFEMGGHSILVVQLGALIQTHFKCDLSLVTIFKNPTVHELACAIETAETGSALPPLKSTSHEGVAPLSFAQQRLWILEKIQGEMSTYNMPNVWSLEGELDVVVLNQSLQQLVSRHEILRTAFVLVDGEPRQKIQADTSQDSRFSFLDFQDLSTDEQATKVKCYVEQQSQQPFDLSQAPLFQAAVICLSPKRHILFFNMHHIISDGWSMGIIAHELAAFYQAISKNSSPILPPLPIQYADFAQWQRQWLEQHVVEKQLKFWHQHLANAPTRLALPHDFPAPLQPSFAGKTCSFKISSEVTQGLKDLSMTTQSTLFMTMLTSFSLLLSRYSGVDDLVIGSPIANRNQSATQPLIGFFVNMLALRIEINPNHDFKTLLGHVRTIALDAYAHQDVPFEKVVERLNPERHTSHHPIFQVIFDMQAPPVQSTDVSDLTFHSMELENPVAQFDIAFSLVEKKGELHGKWQYKTGLFKESSIQEMVDSFMTLLEGITTFSESPVSALPILTRATQNKMLNVWNRSQNSNFLEECAHGLFEHWVEKTPNGVALQFQTQQLTYQELNDRANQLSHHILNHPNCPKTSEFLVGICMERSVEMIVSVLAVLKAGAAFVPLDPHYPLNRLQYMVDDSGMSMLLVQESVDNEFVGNVTALISVTEEQDLIAKRPSNNPGLSAPLDGLAYVIYTSGSTGKPKGVLLEHQGLSNLIHAQGEVFDVHPTSKTLQFASLNFDASVSEIFVTLGNGATLVVPTQEECRPGQSLERTIRDAEITHITLPPSALHLMTPEAVPNLSTLVLAGEACPAHLLKPWSADRQLINAYGPTETTVCATVFRHNVEGFPWSIGTPIANMRCYLLDAQHQMVPLGVAGELYVGGHGVARGYLNRNELNQEKFVSLPHLEAGRLYKTGDLARWLPHGHLEFLNRSDHQIKLRGFRIEPGEIEAVLQELETVKEAVVCLHAGESKSLRAYLVPQTGAELSNSELRQSLNQQLPDYMVPSHFIVLDQLPLTLNGKVDYSILPEIGERLQSNRPHIAARTQQEKQLIALWEELLPSASISVQDNFFEVGGHSLIAIQLIEKIKHTFQCELPFSVLFQFPTIEQLAELLSQQGYGFPESTALVPFQTKEGKEAIFFIPDVFGRVSYLYPLSRLMGEDHSFYALQAQGIDGEQEPLTSVEALASYYAKEICSVLSEKSCILAGHSFGGWVAYELAKQLKAQGVEVKQLFLFDTLAPDQFFALHSTEQNGWQQSLLHQWNAHGFPEIEEEWLNQSVEDFIQQAKERLENNGVRIPMDEKTVRGILQVFQAQSSLQYFPGVEAVAPISLFRSESTFDLENIPGHLHSIYQHAHLGWTDYSTQRLQVHQVAGNHIDMFNHPHVETMADTFRNGL